MGESSDPQGPASADAAVIANGEAVIAPGDAVIVNGDGAAAVAPAAPMRASDPCEPPLPSLFEELGPPHAAAPAHDPAEMGDAGDPTHPRVGVSLVSASGAIFGAALGSLAGQEAAVVGAVLGAVAGWFAGRR